MKGNYIRTDEIKKKISDGMKKAIAENRASGVFKVGTLIRNSGRTRFKKGNKSWNEGLKLDYAPHPKMVGKTPWNKGLVGVMPVPWNKGIKWPENSGENHFAWKGGTYDKDRKIDMGRKKYRDWRKSVLERDNYTCIWCGSCSKLNTDHIKSYALYPKLRYEIDNGRTLCEECHKTTKTYGSKSRILKDKTQYAYT